MQPLEAYLRDLHALHASGAATAETSYYSAIKALVDAVGEMLRPPVRCITNPASLGSGIPDLGLYTGDRFQVVASGNPRKAALPARGVMEVKPPSADVEQVAASAQVQKYLERYRQVLVLSHGARHTPAARARPERSLCAVLPDGRAAYRRASR